MFQEFTIDDRSVFAAAACIYLITCAIGGAQKKKKKTHPRALMFSLIALGFATQTLGLNLRGAEIKACPLGNIFEIAQFISWSLILLYFIVGPVLKLRLLGLFAAGLTALISGLSSLVPAWDRPYPPGIFGGNPWIELHAALAIFSYGVFAIVALVSVMFLIQQRGLKKKQFGGVYQFLPSVQQLDLIAKRLMITGVIVLSAALIFGAVFWLDNPDRVPFFKLGVTCLIWFGYLVVVALRMQQKLVTKRHAIAAIVLFILAMASLWPVESARQADISEQPPAPTRGQ